MPERFKNSKTEDQPSIIFDQEKNIFEIEGRSLPENSEEFYAPVKDWIIEYAKNPNCDTHLICKLDYFNSSSARRLIEIFILLKEISNETCKVKVTWYCEKDDLMLKKKGAEMLSIIDIPFEIIDYQ